MKEYLKEPFNNSCGKDTPKRIEFKDLDKKLQEEILERIKVLETTEIPYFINNEPVLIINIIKVLNNE